VRKHTRYHRGSNCHLPAPVALEVPVAMEVLVARALATEKVVLEELETPLLVARGHPEDDTREVIADDTMGDDERYYG